MNDTGPVGDIARHFALLSLLTVGGVVSVLPEMHREAVEIRHWLSDAEFTRLFAIAQASPGPNMLVVTLIGWHVAGFLGGLAATAAMCVPTSLLTFFAVKGWDGIKDRPWRGAVQDGLTAVTIGLFAASAYLLTRSAGADAGLLAIALGMAVLSFATRLNPIWGFAAAAALGAAGLV